MAAPLIGGLMFMSCAEAKQANTEERELPGYVEGARHLYQNNHDKKNRNLENGNGEASKRKAGRNNDAHKGDTKVNLSERHGGADKDGAEAQVTLRKVRLTWQLVPGAVRYQVVLLRDKNDTPENVVSVQNYVFTEGLEIDIQKYGERAKDFYWKVCPLTFEGNAMGSFSEPKPIIEGELNPKAPRPTTEYDKMDYFPLYPVFSWIPTSNAKHHEVEVVKHTDEGDVVIRRLYGGEYDVYEEGGYTTPGDYAWRVRSVTDEGYQTSDWCEPVEFHVTSPVKVAAFGDSITHGGGAISIPLSFAMYNWETYSPVPVKNLGMSGDTTGDMLYRFDRDVLPFQPKILVVMGGVNDCRGSVPGWETVMNLAKIRTKCLENNIIPVFVTVTPVNPGMIANRGILETPREDWQVHQEYVNDWIIRQSYHVDVHSVLSDINGHLDARYTSDGLHPDMEAKQYIGETVGAYLIDNFPNMLR